MSITEDYGLPTFTLDGNVLPSIRQAVASFYQRCGLKYVEVKLDETLYTECCQEAINRGFPMDGNYSIRPYLAVGVATFCPCYTYLPSRDTKMWICLLTAVSTCVDDILNRGQDTVDLYHFNERFVNCQPQGDPVLDALDALFREAPRHYSPLVANLIITSSLDFVSGLLLERDTEGMQILAKAPLYSEYSRLISSYASAYALFIFPSTVPHRDFIQSMPDLIFIVCTVNDILSFYKEECAGDAANYVSLVAASGGLTKQNALHVVIEKTMQAHDNILECLKPHPEAYDAYVSFFDGYIKFHAALRRYKLEEIMLEGPICPIS
ncbi:terpenoid synthase [Rhizopogon vinicolor AM-OR11-026]|uniref:Terpenoid synthase n=1 Tax=Rhizopogon vinicolor AM-OR11-026 TaxID=1314800 RepID=A0A1B7N3Q7_9AGAM|nr:terpenoid synthase [Rhizopogon vinicolor AM-OR11-026]